MSNIWNPYEEKTKQLYKVLEILSEYKFFILTLLISIIISYTMITMWSSYLYRTQNNIPCKEVLKLLNKGE